MAGKHDITIEQGATFSKTFTWRADNGSDPPSGPIVDLTGCSARMQIRSNITSNTVILELTTTNGLITLLSGSVADHIQITIPATTTAGLSGWTTAVYDLEIVTASGFVTRLLKGTVTLDPEVTR